MALTYNRDLILIYSGLKGALPTLQEKELGYCTDTFELFIGTAAGNLLIASSSAGGPLTSVGLTMPTDVFNVTNSPITTSGSLTVAFDEQIKNLVFAGPTTGANAAPTFRALVNDDIPDILSITKISNLTSNSVIKTSGSDGTLSIFTSTFADTYVQGGILHAATANTIAALAPGAIGSFLMSNGASAALTYLAAGADGYMLVGAGVTTIPVWTASTGTGSPVRGTSPTFTTQITTPQITAAANLTFNPTGDIVLDPTGNDVYPTTNYDLNLGLITNKFLTLHAAELWVETLVAQNTIATIGGRILVGPTTPLAEDCAALDNHIHVKYNNLASGDRVYLEAEGKVEFMAVTSAASGGAGNYSYDVTRNLDGSGANAWVAGDAVFNTGTTGDGWIDLYALAGVLSSGVGPTIVGNVRTGTDYNAYEPRWAIGNLNGLYGYAASDLYGCVFGVHDAAWVKIDPTNGVRIGHNATTCAQIDASGNATFTGTINATAGYLASGCYVGDGATRVAIEAAGINVGNTGSIRGGQTAYNTGTGFWLGYDTAAYKFSIGNSAGNRLTWDGSALTIVGDIKTSTTVGVTKGVHLSAADNQLYFYGDRGDTTIELLTTIGIGDYSGIPVILQSGTANSTGIAGLFQTKNYSPIYSIRNHYGTPYDEENINVWTFLKHTTGSSVSNGISITTTMNHLGGNINTIGGINITYGDGGGALSYTTGTAYGVRTYFNFYGGVVTNLYELFLEGSAGTATITNRYAIYQSNAAAKNYFAGYTLATGGIRVGTTATDPGDNNLYVEGVSTFIGAITANQAVAAMTTAAESWVGPSSTTGVYFKGGLVGIGTTGPGTSLSVGTGYLGANRSGGNLKTFVGGTGGTSSLSAFNGLSLLEASDVRVGMEIGVMSVSPYSSWIQSKDTANNGLTFPLVLQPNGGNVGIGTTNPLGVLAVNQGTGGPGIRIDANSVYGTSIDFYNTFAGGNNWSIQSGRTDIGVAGSFILTNITTTGHPFLVTPSGNIGMGYNDPGTAKLAINGNVGIGTTTVSARLHSLATTEQLRLGYDASNYNSFTVSNIGSLTIAAVGTNPNIVLTPGGTGYTNISAGKFFINDTANTKMAIGITVNQGANSGENISCKAAVAHGITDYTETDTYGALSLGHDISLGVSSGGINLTGYTTETDAIKLFGFATTSDTTTSTAARGAIESWSNLKSGTGATSFAANDNIFVIFNYTAAKFIVKGDGDIYYDGADQGTYDKYNDALMCRDLSYTLSNQLGKVLQYNKEALVKAGVISESLFVSRKGMDMLTLGAIGQMYNKIEDVTMMFDPRDQKIATLEKRVKELETKA